MQTLGTILEQLQNFHFRRGPQNVIWNIFASHCKQSETCDLEHFSFKIASEIH